MNRKKNKPEDVWKRIDIKSEDECWEWQGSLVNKKYGKMIVGWKYCLTHRIVYELKNGNIPPEMVVCHKCDNPKCCNPKHLFLGTQKDNIHDMISKGREKRYSKLTKIDVLEIRKLYATGNYTHTKLGKLFSVDRKNISCIVNNKTWLLI